MGRRVEDAYRLHKANELLQLRSNELQRTLFVAVAGQLSTTTEPSADHRQTPVERAERVLSAAEEWLQAAKGKRKAS